MPNYYALTRKSAPDAGYVTFIAIDEEMCAHFEVTPHPVNWYCDWENVVGFALACGRTFQYIRDEIEKHAYRDPVTNQLYDEDVRLIEVIEWLDDNFTVEAWARIGK